MLNAGQRLGDFEIIRSLGKGGMSEVYEALQHNPERPVALKVLSSFLASTPDAVARFEREAAVLAQLDHPGIIRIFTTGRTEDGTFYYTMQLIRGPSLHRLMKDSAGKAKRAPAEGTTRSDAPTSA
jgi:serine/threonine-protein kinase